jgi:hypothetical protein
MIEASSLTMYEDGATPDLGTRSARRSGERHNAAAVATLSASRFAAGMLALMAGSALLAGWAPLGFSIVILFLFAGPHNWIELRYFLSRMPSRWGKLRGFFTLALGGVMLLSTVSILLPWLTQELVDSVEPQTLYGLWNSLVVAWVMALISLRSRHNPRRDWAWTYPIALALLVLNWLSPLAWYIGILYVHPLLALWMLDRELLRCRPGWRPGYHASLFCLPFVLAGLCWRLADGPPLPGNDSLTLSIAQAAGAGVFPGVSSRMLVGSHAFLTMVHYGVWVLAMPLVGLPARIWRIESIPLARRSHRWRTSLICMLAAGAVAVLVLWAGFLADYPLTRDLYVSVAIVHILAEIPFLLRSF